MFDTVLTVETPESIDLPLRLAGPVVRGVAFALDGVVRLGLYIALGTAASALGTYGVGLFLLILFFVEWFYPVFFEICGDGMTPGKWLLGLQVLHDDGTPIGWSASAIRNLLRFVDFLPIFWGFGVMSMLLHHQFKRLGDIAAGTVVIYRDRTAPAVQRPSGEPIVPPVALTVEEQRAVVDFAERNAQLNPERARELAQIASPLNAASDEPVARLCRIANALAGGR